jgi:hypothetical protein
MNFISICNLFQEVQASRQIPLWFLFLKIENSGTYIGRFSRTDFIKLLSNNNEFSELLKNTIRSIHETLIENEQKIRAQRQKQLTQQALYHSWRLSSQLNLV